MDDGEEMDFGADEVYFGFGLSVVSLFITSAIVVGVVRRRGRRGRRSLASDQTQEFAA